MGDPTDPDFLNAITSVTPGSVQQSYIDFTGTATYTDILRVYINGTDYNARGGETEMVRILHSLQLILLMI